MTALCSPSPLSPSLSLTLSHSLCSPCLPHSPPEVEAAAEHRGGTDGITCNSNRKYADSSLLRDTDAREPFFHAEYAPLAEILPLTVNKSAADRRRFAATGVAAVRSHATLQLQRGIRPLFSSLGINKDKPPSDSRP